MTKYFFMALTVSMLLLSACGGTAETNSNAGQANMNGATRTDANNLPPGLSGSPVPTSANATPGIPDPANAVNVPKGATPTPGIPDPKDIGKPMKPGATPTPGIPSPEEIRRQLEQQRRSNVSAPPPPPPGTSEPAMRSNKKKPGPVNRP